MSDRERVLSAIEYIRKHDCDFLTAESVGMYAGVSTEDTREIMLAEGYSATLVG